MKRIIFWLCFVVILGLIIWGLIVAAHRSGAVVPSLGTPSVVTDADHIRGALSAPVTIIEYSDFQCPACAAYMSLVEKLINESSTTVRFVYRHFPLYPQPHKNSLLAAEATEAAAIQGAFWGMYQLLFENQTAWENSADPTKIFEGYAARIGINTEAFRRDMSSDGVRKRVETDRDEAVSLGVNATPTFFVNGKAIPNPQSYEAFKKTIDDATRAATN